MRGFDILVSETRSRTIYDLESEMRDRASHSQAGSPKPAPRQASRWTAWGLAWTPPHPVLGAGADRCGRGARRAALPVTGSGSLRYPGSLRARAAAHSHSPDGAHLRTSCPVLASGGLRSAHRRSVTGRRRVAGTAAFRRPDDHPAGSGTSRGPGRGFAPSRLSTCPQPRLSTCAQGTHQRIYPNHPQTYPQEVTLGRPKGCR